MQINGVEIQDTFAEAFPMTATRLIITAADRFWARRAAESMTGFATSVIGCGCEAGIEKELDPSQTPDGRPGIAVLIFSVSGKELEKQVVRRVGQCVLTCPSTSVFAGMQGEKKVALGSHLRYFGDGFQLSKVIGDRRYWRIPVMDGEFVCEESTARCKAVGGGNFLVLSESLSGALKACESAMHAMRQIPNVIMPFPGGVARSGSKVGSKYKSLNASTNDAYCPTLRTVTTSLLPVGVTAALEVVIDGLTQSDVERAMRVGILAACEVGERHGLRAIAGGNYGGKLGPYHFHLHEILG
ncbi:formylmethanofuran--tetrahydromethanopterin N-formyltransferase [Aureliella helgolandensis]|uniref:Formylmethanofuran--tetrahydromethanopterin formyltransferase n=1 Tax=Aureliella helgolandensis TaxID=2527968 RepID=A0A518G0N5_9BACT|nr:formylmethanofuran--tetrahydromethanopterin N-formyltransferase [Aureliella helgolandensis]QDV22167.1 Formyltransferase/hydrolase complex subunit D [Aureliella helgolandensis]